MTLSDRRRNLIAEVALKFEAKAAGTRRHRVRPDFETMLERHYGLKIIGGSDDYPFKLAAGRLAEIRLGEGILVVRSDILDHGGAKLREILAHELAHFLLHADETQLDLFSASGRKKEVFRFSPIGRFRIELEAHLAATLLLVPRSQLFALCRRISVGKPVEKGGDLLGLDFFVSTDPVYTYSRDPVVAVMRTFQVSRKVAARVLRFWELDENPQRAMAG